MKKKLNRRNMRKFCNYLHDGKEYVPLICGDIAKDQDDIITCCALGEMYVYFLDKPLFEEQACSFTSEPVVDSISSGMVVEELISNSGLGYYKGSDLEDALNDVADTNDRTKFKGFEARTLAVIETIEKHVIPLLPAS